MKLTNRAKSFYSDEYFISQDIKFELEMMYLRVNGAWRECEESTRSINFDDMLDSQGNKIFASLSEDGKGGDLISFIFRIPNRQVKAPVVYKNGQIIVITQGYNPSTCELYDLETFVGEYEAIGIQE